MKPKIDFYLIDSADIINFEPIYYYLEDAMFIADPRIDWLDFDRAINYLKERNLPFRKSPRLNVDCVITTQPHRVIDILEYKQAISMRLMYGVSEKNRNHQFYCNKGFDAILVTGEYSKQIISRYMPSIIVGFPKYDAFFRGELNKEKISKQLNLDSSKKTILYLPTWRIHSSLDKYRNAIKKIVDLNEYNFIFKPHTVTVRKERYRINYFHQQIKEGKMILLEQQIGLDKLFTVADIVIADGMSGAFWESVFIANLPTLAIYTEGEFEKTNLETQVHKFAIVNNDPDLLIDDLKRVESEHSKFKGIRNNEGSKIIAFRDGTAGKKAADEIQNFIKSKKKKKGPYNSIVMYPLVYLSKGLRSFNPFKKWFKDKIKHYFPTLVVFINYIRKNFEKNPDDFKKYK